MGTIEIIAQIMGIFGMFGMVLSYQQKTQKMLILFQLFGAAFFFLNFLLLGIAEGTVLVATVLNFIGILRAIVFGYKEKFHAEKKIWLYGFIASYIAAYVMVFTVFGTELNAKNAIIELLPVIAMVASNIAFFKKDARAVRFLGFIASPSWLVYDIINLSIGGIVTESLSLVSIVTGIIRYDLKKGNKKNEA